MAKTMQKLDSKLQKQQQGWSKISNTARKYSKDENLGPVPERRNNSIPGINVPYFRDNFIPGINSVPERKNSAIQGINLG